MEANTDLTYDALKRLVLEKTDLKAQSNATALRSRITLEGSLQIADIYHATPDAVRAQVRALIRDDFDDGRGLIICPTASPYMAGEGGRCLARYQAMAEEVIRN